MYHVEQFLNRTAAFVRARALLAQGIQASVTSSLAVHTVTWEN